jgi:hypothetical protein
MGIPRKEIFCTSVEGRGVKSGDDFREKLREVLRGCKIAILIATPNYKMSEICLNEMGAAWSLDCKVLPCIVDLKSDFQAVGVLLNPKQAENLVVETELDDLREAIEKEIKIKHETSPATWTVKKRKFLESVRTHLKAHPFPNVVSNSEFEKLKNRNAENDDVIDKLLKQNLSLEKINQALKNAKDKKEVETIEEKYSEKSEMDSLAQYVKAVRESLVGFSSVLNAFIYMAISGKQLTIEYSIFESDIQEAIAKGYLSDDDDEPQVDWESTSDMQEVRQSVEKLEKFLTSKPRGKLWEQHKRKYGINPDLTNLAFWTRVIGAKISYK